MVEHLKEKLRKQLKERKEKGDSNTILNGYIRFVEYYYKIKANDIRKEFGIKKDE